MTKELILPGNTAVQMPSETAQLLNAIAQNQKALYQALLGIQKQLEILIRLECGADKRAMWKERFADLDMQAMLEDAAQEASKNRNGDGLDETEPDLSEFDTVKDGGEDANQADD